MMFSSTVKHNHCIPMKRGSYVEEKKKLGVNKQNSKSNVFIPISFEEIKRVNLHVIKIALSVRML